MIRKLKCKCGNSFKITGTAAQLEFHPRHILCWDCDPKVQKEQAKELGLIDAAEAERVKATLR